MPYRELAYELIDMRSNHGRMKEFRDFLEQFTGEDWVLAYLWKRGSCAYPSELGQAMEVSTARIAAILNRLEERGFIVRTPSPEDNRRVSAALTVEGIEAIARIYSQTVDRIIAMLEQMGPEDAAEYVRLTKKALGILSSQRETTPAEIGGRHG